MLQCPLLLHLHLCLAFQRCRQKRLSAARIRKAVCLLPVITKKPHKKIPLHSSRHNNMIVVIDINHTNNTIPCQSHLYHRINSRPASLTSAFSEDRCRAWWQTYAGTRKRSYAVTTILAPLSPSLSALCSLPLVLLVQQQATIDATICSRDGTGSYLPVSNRSALNECCRFLCLPYQLHLSPSPPFPNNQMTLSFGLL